MSEALLQELLDAGTPPMLVVRVGAEMARLAAEAAALDRRRRADKERQQAKRDAEKADCHVMSRDVADVADETDANPFLDKSPQTPKINPTPGVCVGDAPARKAGPFPCPDDCDPGDWRDLLANRKSKRLPMTPAAYRKLLRDLETQTDDEWPPGRILRHAAERGWAAIFDPRQSNGTSNGYHRPANRPTAPTNPMLAARQQRRAREACG